MMLTLTSCFKEKTRAFALRPGSARSVRCWPANRREIAANRQFPVSLSEVFSENGKDFLFWLNAAWIGKVEINDVADLVQAQSELLELVDFPQAGNAIEFWCA